MLRTLQFAAIIAVAVLLLSVVGMAYLKSSPPPHNQGQQQTSGQQENENEPQGQGSRRSVVQFLFPDSISIFNFLLVIATVALAYVAIVQLGSLNRSEITSAKAADAAKQSADVAKAALVASNRPWVKIEGVMAASPLTWDADGNGQVAIQFALKNTGNAPALAVLVMPSISVRPEDGFPARDPRNDPGCKQMRNAGVRAFNSGKGIFPGDKPQIFGNYILKISKDEAAAAQAALGGKLPENGNYPEWQRKLIMPVIVGCVDYVLPVDGNHHQTGFRLSLGRRFSDPTTLGAIIPGTDVPADQIILTDAMGGGSYAD